MNERDKELANVIYGSQWTSQDIEFADLIRADEREKFCALLRQLHDSYSLASNPNNIRARGNA